MKVPAHFSSFLWIVMCLCSEAAVPSVAPTVSYGKTCPQGYYGYNCRHHCHCRDPRDCDVTPRCAGGCADGWSGPTCQSQNTAYRMPTQIRGRGLQDAARLAVDGNSSTCVTSDPKNPGWLRVDLQQTITVYYLSLITDNVTSPRGWQVYVTPYSDFYWATPCATVRSARRHVHMSCDAPSPGRYLTVLNTLGPVTVCEIQAHVCADYTFGTHCDAVCRCADASEVCHPLNGHCTTGCLPGFSGRHCQNQCYMSYGPNCITPCGQCSRHVSCHPVTGQCPGPCMPGWTGQNCNITCPAGRYGPSCSKRCGGCEDSEPCAPDTGLCTGLCEPGLKGPRCDQECEGGKHGPSCQFHCGHCAKRNACNTSTGICPKGCDSGWEGLFCTQECLPHNYGRNCRQSCPHCVMSCDSVTGLCDVSGCTSGKTGPMCEEDCPGGYYGINCSSPCGHCLETDRWCDVITGHCPLSLCKPGWTGETCHMLCRARMYGMNCSLECGSCEGSDVCHHVTGLCPNGCADGFHGEMCTVLTIFLDTTSEASIALIASTLTIAMLVLVIVCVCLALKWRRDSHIMEKPEML